MSRKNSPPFLSERRRMVACIQPNLSSGEAVGGPRIPDRRAVAVVGLLQLKIPFTTLKFLVAASLFALGLYRVFRSRHPRGAGMRVGFRDLAVWSFLMASAHGAGLMLAPVLLAPTMQGMHHSMYSGLTSSSFGIAP